MKTQFGTRRSCMHSCMASQQHKGSVAPWMSRLGKLYSGLTTICESRGQGNSYTCAVATPIAMPPEVPGGGEGSLQGFSGAPIAHRFDREFAPQTAQPAAVTSPGRHSLGEQKISLTGRADSTFLSALPDTIARAGPSLCCLGSSAPSPCPCPLWQVPSVLLECGVHAQPVQLSPPAAPWSFRALGAGSPCPLAVGYSWLVWPTDTDRAQIRAIVCASCAEIFAAGPEKVLQDPFRIWFLSIAGFHCRTPASIPAPLTWKQESILRKCLACCWSQHPQHGFAVFR